MLYYAGSGVKRVRVVSQLRIGCLFVFSIYIFSVGMIGCLLFLCLCRCVLMLSALVVSFTYACSVGVSDVHMFKKCE